jgi:hypothetical protein
MKKERRKSPENPSKTALLYRLSQELKKIMSDDSTTSDEGCMSTTIDVSKTTPVNVVK